ncbi:hypothetical protein T484DRAFT_1961102 [Baffinella frigidus]|nr:hypothetical protein T484DRAFT_1961102 [Cryptophyta sp. CCMP2293]
MRSMCGADAGCLAISYQSLVPGGRAHPRVTTCTARVEIRDPSINLELSWVSFDPILAGNAAV